LPPEHRCDASIATPLMRSAVTMWHVAWSRKSREVRLRENFSQQQNGYGRNNLNNGRRGNPRIKDGSVYALARIKLSKQQTEKHGV
jgi:hypothetical protein